MSSTTQLPISEELRSFWNSEAKSGKTRTIRVVIKNGIQLNLFLKFTKNSKIIHFLINLFIIQRNV